MADIFLSYSRKDIDRIESFIKILEQENWSVWWDSELRVGKEFPEVIDEELKKARCVVVLWSENSIKSRWVKIEANAANNRDILVPALIDNVSVPLQFSLLNTANLSHWDGKNLSHPEIKNFLRSIRNIIESSASPAAPNNVVTKPPEIIRPVAPVVQETTPPNKPDSDLSFEIEEADSSKMPTTTLLVIFGALVVFLLMAVTISIYIISVPSENTSTVNTSPTPSATAPTAVYTPPINVQPTYELTPSSSGTGEGDEPKLPTQTPIPKSVSGGVVNSKAIDLVKPEYPRAARAVRASGEVAVEVTIDEKGNVISAKAVNGHVLLHKAAESAALASKFKRTEVSGVPVKVTGVITYNFVP